MGITRRAFVRDSTYAAILAASGCLKKAGEKVADIAVKDTPQQLMNGPPGGDFQYDRSKIPYDLGEFKYIPDQSGDLGYSGIFLGGCDTNGARKGGDDLCIGAKMKSGMWDRYWVGFLIQNGPARQSWHIFLTNKTAEIDYSVYTQQPKDLEGKMHFYGDKSNDLRMVRVEGLLKKMRDTPTDVPYRIAGIAATPIIPKEL